MASVASTVENFGAMAFIILFFFGLQFRLFDLVYYCLPINKLGLFFLGSWSHNIYPNQVFRLILAFVGNIEDVHPCF
jgi:hypothetical protein